MSSNKEDKVKKMPKKRGRKPKSNITVNKNPVFDQKIDNLVVCLKKKNNEDHTSNDIPGYIKESCYIDENENNNSDLLCWNCCHSFHNNNKKEIPINYDNDIFHTYGNFCSFECGGRYLINNFNGSELWEKISLLNIYYNISTNKRDKLRMAPPIQYLSRFGGNLSIDEYRKHSSYTDCIVNLPTIIPVYNTFHKYDAKIKQNENKEYNLFRKKPLKNDNNILETMNIKQ